jgi:glycosyltransferase involved in cell wall biosynthesis
VKDSTGAGNDVAVVMLTRNAGSQLAASLASVAWAAEIIALDDGSSDATREVLLAHGATVMTQDRELIRAHAGNFDVARNPGFAQAKANWIFVLDADEVVSAALRDEILHVTTETPRAAYTVPRTNLYWGRASRVLGEDRQLRLFPRGSGRYVGTRLDQPVEVDCPVADLAQPLLHRQTRLLHKLWERTGQRAGEAVRRGEVPPASPLSLFWHHLRWYLFHQESWRDGGRGVALAAIYAGYPALEAARARRILRRLARQQPRDTGV